jgi:hypothetical protein
VLFLAYPLWMCCFWYFKSTLFLHRFRTCRSIGKHVRRVKSRFPSSFVFAIQFSRNKRLCEPSRSSQRQKSSYHTCFSGSTLKSLAVQPIAAIRYRWSSFFGGAKRDRTADLLLARQALSQLSYGPMSRVLVLLLGNLGYQDIKWSL